MKMGIFDFLKEVINEMGKDFISKVNNKEGYIPTPPNTKYLNKETKERIEEKYLI